MNDSVSKTLADMEFDHRSTFYIYNSIGDYVADEHPENKAYFNPEKASELAAVVSKWEGAAG